MLLSTEIYFQLYIFSQVFFLEHPDRLICINLLKLFVSYSMLYQTNSLINKVYFIAIAT